MPACLISVSSIFKNLTRHLSTPCTLSFSLSLVPYPSSSVCLLVHLGYVDLRVPSCIVPGRLCIFPVCSFVERNFGSFPPYRRREKSFFFLNRTIMRGSFSKCTPILDFFLCVRGVNKRKTESIYGNYLFSRVINIFKSQDRTRYVSPSHCHFIYNLSLYSCNVNFNRIRT